MPESTPLCPICGDPAILITCGRPECRRLAAQLVVADLRAAYDRLEPERPQEPQPCHDC